MVRAPCCEKSMGLKKGPWTPDEDEKLLSYIKRHGHGSWRSLPKQAGLLRCGKSCRLRWTNYLRPDIKRGNFSSEEEQTIIYLHSVLGNRWSSIASHLPGRTDNEIKNYWNTHVKKRMLRMGLDPMNHKPLEPDQGHGHMLPSHDAAQYGVYHQHQEEGSTVIRYSRNGGEAALERAMTFPSSYLEQLKSCGLDISGFLMHYRKQSMRLQQQQQQQQLSMPFISSKHTSPFLMTACDPPPYPASSSLQSSSSCRGWESNQLHQSGGLIASMPNKEENAHLAAGGRNCRDLGSDYLMPLVMPQLAGCLDVEAEMEGDWGLLF